MKKFTLVLALSFLFVFTAYAEGDDGHVPIGGKSCPNGQTSCFVSFEPNTDQDSTGVFTKNFSNLFDYFKSLFD